MKALAISIFFFSVFHIFLLRGGKNPHKHFRFMPFISALLFSHLVPAVLLLLHVDFAIQQYVNKTVYIGDYHLKSNIHAGREKYHLQLLLKSTMLTFKETANTKTSTNRNFTVKAYSTYTLTRSSASIRILLTMELQWFQTIALCNVSPTQQPNTPTQDHKSCLEARTGKKSP